MNIKLAIWRYKKLVQSRLGLLRYSKTVDRLYQENLLYEATEYNKNLNILYAGVAWYTLDYYSRFFNGSFLTTVDIDPDQAVFGSKHHIVGDLGNEELHNDTLFDLIYLFGLIGYGVNCTSSLYETMQNAKKLLKRDGSIYITLEETSTTGDHLKELDLYDCCRSEKLLLTEISEWMDVDNKSARMKFYKISCQ